MSTFNLADLKLSVKPCILTAWVAENHGVDLACRWGREDGAEYARRNSEMFVLASPEYHSYHAAYNAALRLRHQMYGDVSKAALDECAWFDEISGAPVAVARLTDKQLAEIEAERPGHELCTHPEAW